MQVVYDSGQDLILILTREEKEILTRVSETEFFENPIRALSLHLGAYVYLAYSADRSGILRNSRDLDGLGKILVPDPDSSRDPWLINLSDKGIEHLRNGWNCGMRYKGSSKLFVKVI